jgi:hypothetical protein
MAHCGQQPLALVATLSYFFDFGFKEVNACHGDISASNKTARHPKKGRRADVVPP